MAGRVGASLLLGVGLPSCVCGSLKQMEDEAVGIGVGDRAHGSLEQLRATLRRGRQAWAGRSKQAALWDTEQTAKDWTAAVENAVVTQLRE